MFLHADAHFGIHENLASIIDGPGKVEEDFRSEWVVGINQVTQVAHPPTVVPHKGMAVAISPDIGIAHHHTSVIDRRGTARVLANRRLAGARRVGRAAVAVVRDDAAVPVP